MVMNRIQNLAVQTAISVSEKKNKVFSKIGPAVNATALTVAGASFALGASADAAQTASDLFGNVITVIAAICIIAGVIFFIWGMVGIGMANASDNGGQEKDKAQKKILGAIAVIAVGAVLFGMKSTLSDYISNAISDASN